MAIGKPRGNKRPYGGSCSSTITTVVLTAVCLLGIWLIITSNSTTSPSNTTTLINTSIQDASVSFLKLNRKIPVDSTKDKLVDLSVNTSVSEEDVIQHDDDDESKTLTNQDKLQEMDQNNKPDDDDSDRLAEPETEPTDDDADSLNDSDVGKQEAEQHQEEAKEEQEIEIIEDNTNESEEKEHEQKAQKIKVTDDQQTDDSGNQEDKLTEAGNENDDIRDLEDNQEQEITDQERENGTENQQEQQEQNEDDRPIESHSIAAETKARVENQEAVDIRNKMEQAKIESTIANTTIPVIKASNVDYSTVPKGDVNGNSDQSDKWELCNVTNGTDYIPCFDNEIAIRNSHHRHHYTHKERHCPNESPQCLVPLPQDYKTPILWPQSRDKIWFHNVPNKALSDLKELQNWVKVTGEFITFPKGALRYIDFLQEAVPKIAWGKQTRVVLDVGCGVASFGGYLFDKDVLAMSIASKDEHEAQIQFALERGIPAISNTIGTQRLPFPSRVFDLVHCVRCKVAWHKDGGIRLLEVNRLLRPGGYFVWSAMPVYRTLEEEVQVWKEMSALTVAMCWELVTIKKDRLNAIGVAIYHKPEYSNECYNVLNKQQPPLCKPDDDPNFAWYVPLQTCMHMVPMRETTERGSHWPEAWPGRVQEPPYWLNRSQVGSDGKPAPSDFKQDYEHWKSVISKSYMSDLGINWSNIRNVMDMRAVYGGFAAALKDLKLWVLNVVNVDSSDTLEIIFERGLLGIYHDWCESFSTYPRTYDLLHADHLFSNLKNRCKIKAVMAEIDRILRPGGNLIARDEPSVIREMEKLLESLHWEVNSTFTNEEGVISGRKSMWRPTTYVKPS